MKYTPTEYPIIDAIKERWSPRSFTDEQVTDGQLHSIFEAARWAPSAMNEQPWRFVYARTGERAFEQIAQALFEGNSWAKAAPVLIVTLARNTYTRNDKPNGSAQHDLGLAVANLSAQATHEGLSLHQMGGVDKEALRRAFDVPQHFDVVTVIALGKRGNPDDLPENLKERELAERKRRPIEEFAFHGSFKEYENSIA